MAEWYELVREGGSCSVAATAVANIWLLRLELGAEKLAMAPAGGTSAAGVAEPRETVK